MPGHGFGDRSRAHCGWQRRFSGPMRDGQRGPARNNDRPHALCGRRQLRAHAGRRRWRVEHSFGQPLRKHAGPQVLGWGRRGCDWRQSLCGWRGGRRRGTGERVTGGADGGSHPGLPQAVVDADRPASTRPLCRRGDAGALDAPRCGRAFLCLRCGASDDERSGDLQCRPGDRVPRTRRRCRHGQCMGHVEAGGGDGEGPGLSGRYRGRCGGPWPLRGRRRSNPFRRTALGVSGLGRFLCCGRCCSAGAGLDRREFSNLRLGRQRFRLYEFGHRRFRLRQLDRHGRACGRPGLPRRAGRGASGGDDGAGRDPGLLCRFGQVPRAVSEMEGRQRTVRRRRGEVEDRERARRLLRPAVCHRAGKRCGPRPCARPDDIVRGVMQQPWRPMPNGRPWRRDSCDAFQYNHDGSAVTRGHQAVRRYSN